MPNHITSGLVPGLLRDIYVERRTGMLDFASGDERCRIRFVKGHIVHGQATARELRLGEVMQRQGMLTAEQLAAASEVVIRERRRLGQVLEELGLANAEQVEAGLALHVREILVRALSWKTGTCDFLPEEYDGPSERDFRLRLTTGELILEAVRRVSDPGAIRYGVGDPETVVMPATSALLRFQRINLSPIEGFVLSRIDGTSTIREVAQITPLPALEVEKSLFALLCTGVIEHATAAPAKERPAAAQFLRQEILDLHASLRQRSPHEMLGVAAQASEAEVKAAYFRLAKRFHPDVHRDPALGDLRDKLEAIFVRIGECYEILSRPRSGVARTSSGSVAAPASASAPQFDAPLNPEELFARADERLGESKYWEAIALLGEVVAVAKGALLQRARVKLARAYLKYPDYEKHAERVLLAAVAQDAEYAEAYNLLGGIYGRGGLATRAAAMYRKVLEIKPNHREAQSELAALTEAAETPPRQAGVLKKMFKA